MSDESKTSENSGPARFRKIVTEAETKVPTPSGITPKPKKPGKISVSNLTSPDLKEVKPVAGVSPFAPDDAGTERLLAEMEKDAPAYQANQENQESERK